MVFIKCEIACLVFIDSSACVCWGGGGRGGAIIPELSNDAESASL